MKIPRHIFLSLLILSLLAASLITTSVAAAARSDVEAFVNRFYQIILNRDPDTAGLNVWVDDLLSGKLTGCDIANQFILSPEFKNRNVNDDDFVKTLYSAFFDRAPDAAGFNGWTSELAGGKLRELVINGFTESQEFSNLSEKFGIKATPPSSARFVNRFYQLVLGRSPSPTERNAWVNQMVDGSITASQLVNNFLNSPEFTGLNTSDSQFIHILYAAFFNRDPDEAGFDAFLSRLQSGESRQSIKDNFAGSQEFKLLVDSFSSDDECDSILDGVPCSAAHADDYCDCSRCTDAPCGKDCCDGDCDKDSCDGSCDKDCCDGDCDKDSCDGVRSPGYWTNHRDAWPEIPYCLYGYEEFCFYPEDISSGGANKCDTMIRQIVAMELNYWTSSCPYWCIRDELIDAKAWYKNHCSDGKVEASSDAWKYGEPLYLKLDAYNNGRLCAPKGN